MKSAVKSAERFGRLLVRLWPLWLPLLLVLAWPYARPIVREQVFGSPLAPSDLISLDQIWGELIWGSYEEIANPLPDVSTQPDDLNLQVWQWNWRRSRDETRPNAQSLVARFPDEIVVYALAIRELTPKTQSTDATKPADIARLKALSQKATQLEPDNAYWWVQAATAQELNGHSGAALQLLERAARCPFYDEKDREITRRSLAAFASRRALTWEEKRAVFLLSQLYDSGQNARLWGNRARYLAKRGDARGALRWSSVLASIGDVRGGANASVLTFAAGRTWQRQAWSIGAPPGATRRQQNAANASEQFALYAIRKGRPDLAKTTRAQATRARQTEALLKTARARTDDYLFWLGTDGLGAALRAAQIGGVMLLCAMAYLAVWWMAANIFLWRAVGEPSPRRTRVAFSGGVMAALLALAVLAGWWFWLDSSRSQTIPNLPQHQAYEVIYGTLGAFAFISAPWLLALAIAGVTMWRERAQFALPPRVDLELQLSRGARRLLRWALPFFVVGSALTLVVGWTLAMIALWFNWRNVNLLAWLPPDRNGKTGSLLWDIGNEPWIFIYGLLLCVVCLVGWFVKWRWGTPQRLRPLTHRALRLWKESLGCAVAWGLWVYLLLILLSLPARALAEARLDAVLQHGEIAVMRDLSAPGQV